MKDILKFIFTFSGAEKVLDKTVEEKRKITSIFFLIYILIFCCSGIFGLYYFNIFKVDINILLILQVLIKYILGTIIGLIFIGFIYYIVLWILHTKKNFLESLYIGLIGITINVLNFIITTFLVYKFGILFALEIGYFSYYSIIITIWSLVLNFLLFKKILGKIQQAIIAVILLGIIFNFIQKLF